MPRPNLSYEGKVRLCTDVEAPILRGYSPAWIVDRGASDSHLHHNIVKSLDVARVALDQLNIETRIGKARHTTFGIEVSSGICRLVLT